MTRDLDLSLLRRSFDADPIAPLQPQAGYYVTRNLATMLDGLEPAAFACAAEPVPHIMGEGDDPVGIGQNAVPEEKDMAEDECHEYRGQDGDRLLDAPDVEDDEEERAKEQKSE